MFKYLVEQLPGAEIYAIVPLLIFFSLFIIIVFKAWKADHNYIRKMEQLPLDSSSSNGEDYDG